MLSLSMPKHVAPSYAARHEAMATTFTLTVAGAEPVYVRQAAAAAFRELNRMESLLSRFREGSDVFRINRLARGQATVVDPDTFECLGLADEVCRASGGAFDVAYACPAAAPRFALEPASYSVRALADGLRIDLGGIGKGYALDRMAAVLADWEIVSALLAASTSTLVALDPPPGEPGWPVTLGPDRDEYVLPLAHRAVSAFGPVRTRQSPHRSEHGVRGLGLVVRVERSALGRTGRRFLHRPGDPQRTQDLRPLPKRAPNWLLTACATSAESSWRSARRFAVNRRTNRQRPAMRPAAHAPWANSPLSAPWTSASLDGRQHAFGNRHVLGDLEIKHSRQREIRPVVEDELECVLRWNRAGRHDLEGDPRLRDATEQIPRLFGFLAPHRVEIQLGAGVVVVVEGLHVEICGNLEPLALLHHRQLVAAHAAEHVLRLDHLHRLGDQFRFALGRDGVGLYSPDVDGVDPGVDHLLDRLAELGDVVERHRRAHDALDLPPCFSRYFFSIESTFGAV